MMDETEPILRRRRLQAARRQQRLWIAAGVGLCLCLVVIVGLALAVANRPAALRQGQAWTYRELRDHLEAMGLKYRLTSSEGETYLIVDTFSNDGRAVAMSLAGQGIKSDGVVRLRGWDSPETARRVAGQVEAGRLAWGRFVFESTDSELAKLRTALP